MASKIKLNVDELKVDSFEAAEKQTAAERGTVHGVMSLGCDTRYDGTCNNYGTCHYWGVCSPIP